MATQTTQKVDNKLASQGKVFLEEAQTTYNICKACMGYDTCTYTINLSKPLLHCAEFKPFPSRPVDYVLENQTIVSDKKDDNEYIGLCRNCEQTSSCLYSKPGKSVLNCEEYQ